MTPTTDSTFTVYWPCAIVQNLDDRRARLLYTYDSTTSFEKALEVIMAWKDDNIVLCAWIDRDTGGTPCWFDYCVDGCGNVTGKHSYPA